MAEAVRDRAVRDAAALVDYARSLDCIHCGLCLSSCPTYRLTGREASSPRGRIHLMRAVAEERLEPTDAFADEMEFCLLCRGCESVCPAGVEFASMMEWTRGHVEEHVPRPRLARLARWTFFRGVLPSRAALRALGSGLRLAQRTRLLRLLAPLAGARGRSSLDLPRVARAGERGLLPPVTPARGERRAVVSLLEGCVLPELLPATSRATARSLAELGVECRVLSGVTCCGSLHAHNGDLDGARALARRMIAAFDVEGGGDGDGGEEHPIVVNSAGCGSHMRELHHLFDADDPWHARAHAFSARVRDYSEVAAPLLEELPERPRVPAGALAGPVTWDDPCHLCHGQQIRDEPRRVLAALDGIELVPLEGSELCCGSAGIYSLARPDDAQAVFEPKREAFERSGAKVLVTANPGCQLQWDSGLRRAGVEGRVVHLAELVALALAR